MFRPIQSRLRRRTVSGRLKKWSGAGAEGTLKSTNSCEVELSHLEWVYAIRFPFDTQSKPVVPKLAPKSLTKYRCSGESPRNWYTALFSSFRSQLLITAIKTCNPYHSRVPVKGFFAHDQ